MEKSSKRIWSKEELTIAYFIAKWGLSPLKIQEDHLVECVITNTTKASLSKQVANFRYLLNVEGYQLKDYSKAMESLHEELANKTYTNVKQSIFDYMDSREEIISCLAVKKANSTVDEKKDALNKELNTNFEAKVRMMSQFRNLRPIGRRQVNR